MRIQPFSWHHLNQWHLGVLPNLLLIVVGYLYARGVLKVPTWPRVRSVSFAAGLIVTFLATQSILGVYDMVYFSDHMIQHLLLIMLAAPLFALSAPLDLAYDAGSATIRRWLDSRFMARLTHPLTAFALYFVVIPVVHLTGILNLMMQHPWIHNLEQIGFLVVGYLFFRAAFGLERGVKLHPGLRLVFVMAAVPVDTFTGLALSMSTTIPYNHYLAMSPAGSTKASVLLNLHLGGAIMWIGGDALMLLAGVPISIMWVKWETIRTKELDAILDAQGI
ncbi:MAG TPA: cytochrome c oxidase assembly protein [Acidimicrobiales bacterium]